ncbi:MAG: cyclic nucleotide-binding domain-containing protein [Prochlorotrichaceae cyanobacterium]
MFGLILGIWQHILRFWSAPLFYVGPVSVSIQGISTTLLWILIIVAGCRILKRVLSHYLLARLGIDQGNREALSTIISYFVGGLSSITLLQATGFNLASLAVLAGALGVGIGFGLQNFSRDFIGGLTLLIERSIKVGDFIELGTEDSYEGIKGTVMTIALRSASIQTRDGANLIVPNNRLVECPVLNWGSGGSACRLIIPVRVGRESDLNAVTEVLLNVAYVQGEVVLRSPSPKVCFTSVEEDFFCFELHVWIADMKREEYLRSDIYFTIEQQFKIYDIHFQPSYQDLIIAFEDPEFIDPIATRNSRLRRQKQRLSYALEAEEPTPPLIRDLLRKIKYFEYLNDLEIRKLIEVGYRKRLNPGEILFRESDPGDAFYIILSGSVDVKVLKLNEHLATLSAGDFFGELSLMLGIPRSATVIAHTEALLFAIDHQGFQRLLRRHGDLYEVIISGLGQYQEELQQRQELLRQMNLLDSAEDDKNPVDWARKRLKTLFLP